MVSLVQPNTQDELEKPDRPDRPSGPCVRRRAGSSFVPCISSFAIPAALPGPVLDLALHALARLPFTARIEGAHSDRAASASKKDGLAAPLPIRLRPCVARAHLNYLYLSLEGVAEAALYCAHRTSTVLPCAFCEHEGHLASLPYSSTFYPIGRAVRVIPTAPVERDYRCSLARNFLTRPSTGTPRRAISPSEGLPNSPHFALRGTARLSFTARIEGAHSDRAASASKKDGLAAPLLPF